MAGKREIFLASLKGFGIPILIAAVIVFIQLFSPWQPSEKYSSAIKSFFAALFFIMYFYGQYKRVEKQTEDKSSFQGVSDKLGTLEDLVRKLNSTAPQPVSLGAVSLSAQNLIAEAKNLLAQGHTLASLLQAGVAFEHAFRGFSRHLKVDQYERLPLLTLMQRTEKSLPQGLVGELHALRHVRNRLTHISENELSDLPDADIILRNYEWAISELGNIIGDSQKNAA